MNYKRKKSRQHIRCNLCTDGRQGNSLRALYGRRATVIIQRRLDVVKLKEGVKEYGSD